MYKRRDIQSLLLENKLNKLLIINIVICVFLVITNFDTLPPLRCLTSFDTLLNRV